MKKQMSILLLLVFSIIVNAKTPTPPPQLADMKEYSIKKDIHREGTEWTDCWVPKTNDNKNKYTILIGDSITRQYQRRVTDLLKKECNTGYVATSLSVADPLYLALLTYILCIREYYVIHFNNCLHGPAYTENQYKKGFEKAINLIQKIQPKAEIVLVLSTPLLDGSDKQFQKRILERNKIVRELAEKYKLQIDDLYTPVEHKDELHSDKYHFKPKGVDVLANTVVTKIKQVLNSKK